MSEMKENINRTVQELVEKYGIELLQDINRMNAFLMDYLPQADKERKLIIMVIREGVLTRLLKLKKENEENRRLEINKCIKSLAADIWITEEAARYAIMTLAGAVGLKTDWKAGEETESTGVPDGNHDKPARILTKEMRLVSEEAIQAVLANCDAVGYKALAANTSVEQILLPENVTCIYPKAFLDCVNLKRICLPRALKSIGNGAFEGCVSLEEIVIPDGADFKVIGKVFIDKAAQKALRVENHEEMDSVSIINGVKIICKKAFEHTKVRRIIIPMSVNTIEENAFYMTLHLQNFSVDPKNLCFKEIRGVLHDRKGLILIRYPQGKEDVNYYLEETVKEIGLQAFSCAQNVQTVTFTNTLKKIGNKAFEYCVNLENLILPGNIEIIGEWAFQHCERMHSVMLSRNIKEIGDGAFYNCVSLESVSIPRSVRRIGNLAFANCVKLKNVTIQENVSFIGDGAFDGCREAVLFVKNNSYVEIYCRLHGIVCNKI